jgi:hypothetical protein
MEIGSADRRHADCAVIMYLLGSCRCLQLEVVEPISIAYAVLAERLMSIYASASKHCDVSRGPELDLRAPGHVAML